MLEGYRVAWPVCGDGAVVGVVPVATDSVDVQDHSAGENGVEDSLHPT